MIKQLHFLFFIFFPFLIQAQNVGIGTTTPTEKLEIKNPLRSTLKVSSNSTSDTTELLLSNKTINGFGTFFTDFSIKNVRENGLFFSSQSDLSTNNSVNSLVIRPQGNVGIGTNLPAYKFQVNENVSTNGFMSITNATTGSNGTDGLLLGLTGNIASLTNLENSSLQLGTNNLARAVIDASGNMGIGNLAPAFRLDVSGDINTTGVLRLNGSSGIAGQVLTSNGNSTDPTWVTPAPTHYMGELFGGGVIVAVWKIAGVEHGLIVSLTNLSLATAWNNTGLGPNTALDPMNGQANSNLIIAQPGHTSSAALLCNNYSAGGFSDWYLPALWELRQCFNAGFLVNTIVGSTNSIGIYESYWSSNEIPNLIGSSSLAIAESFSTRTTENKLSLHVVRAVRRF